MKHLGKQPLSQSRNRPPSNIRLGVRAIGVEDEKRVTRVFCGMVDLLLVTVVNRRLLLLKIFVSIYCRLLSGRRHKPVRCNAV